MTQEQERILALEKQIIELQTRLIYLEEYKKLNEKWRLKVDRIYGAINSYYSNINLYREKIKNISYIITDSSDDYELGDYIELYDEIGNYRSSSMDVYNVGVYEIISLSDILIKMKEDYIELYNLEDSMILNLKSEENYKQFGCHNYNDFKYLYGRYVYNKNLKLIGIKYKED